MAKVRKQTLPPPAVPGVYVLRLGVAVYVGASTRCEARIIDHMRDLAWGQHENPVLQRAYGECRGRITWSVRLLPHARPHELVAAERRVLEFHLDRGETLLNRAHPEQSDYLQPAAGA